MNVSILTKYEEMEVLRKVVHSYKENFFDSIDNYLVTFVNVINANVGENESVVEYLEVLKDRGCEDEQPSGLLGYDVVDDVFSSNYNAIFYLYNIILNKATPLSYYNAYGLIVVTFDYLVADILPLFKKALEAKIDSVRESDKKTSTCLINRKLPHNYRVENGEQYHYISDRFQVYSPVDINDELDDSRFNRGNYFRSYEDAEMVAYLLANN